MRQCRNAEMQKCKNAYLRKSTNICERQLHCENRRKSANIYENAERQKNGNGDMKNPIHANKNTHYWTAKIHKSPNIYESAERQKNGMQEPITADRTAGRRKCGNAEVQKPINAEIHLSLHARMNRSTIEANKQCRNAEMQKCRNAEMHIRCNEYTGVNIYKCRKTELRKSRNAGTHNCR